MAIEAAEEAQTSALPLTGTAGAQELVGNVGAAVAMAQDWARETTDSPASVVPDAVVLGLDLAIDGLSGAVGTLQDRAGGIAEEAAGLAEHSAAAAAAYISQIR